MELKTGGMLCVSFCLALKKLYLSAMTWCLDATTHTLQDTFSQHVITFIRRRTTAISTGTSLVNQPCEDPMFRELLAIRIVRQAMTLYRNSA